MKSNLKWVVGSCLGLASVSSIFINHDYLAGICFILMAVVCLPPALETLQEKTGFVFKSWQKWAIFIGFWVLAIITHKRTDPTVNIPVPAPVIQETPKVEPPAATVTPPESRKPTKKTSKKEIAAPKPATYNALSPQSETTTKTRKSPSNYVRNANGRTGGCYYHGRPLQVGRRGGCYYLTENGRKEYVDRSFCSGCD